MHSRKDGKEKDGVIKLKVPSQTHIWRHTEEDGSVNNSPFYFRKITGDFECTVKVSAKMQTWLDQCGILLQEKRGIYTKVSLEYHEPPKENGVLRHYAACYVHPEEWQFERSLNPYPGQFHRGDPKYSYEMLDKGTSKLWLKLSRLEGYVEANYSLDGEDWKELKAAKFSDAETLSIGIFGASPGGDQLGFKCSFENFEVVEDEDLSDSDEEDEGDLDSEGAYDEHEEEAPHEEDTAAYEEEPVVSDYEEVEYESGGDDLSQEEVLGGTKLGGQPSLGIAGMEQSMNNFEVFDDSGEESD